MSVVVAHQASTIGHLTLQEAAKEANLRQVPMAVIHVAEGVDLDVIEAHKAGLERRDHQGAARGRPGRPSSGPCRSPPVRTWPKPCSTSSPASTPSCW